MFNLKVTSLESEKLALVRESESLQGQSDTHSSQLSQTLTELEATKQLLIERDATIITLNAQIDSQVLHTNIYLCKPYLYSNM